MSSDMMRWHINIRNLETHIRVGIHKHEQAPQRVIVNASVEGYYAARPHSIAECYSYELIHQRVAHEWPKRPHTGLLETYVVDLLEYVFQSDKRIASVKVSLSKPDAFAEAESAGVEAEWTRADFERLCG